MLSLMKASGRKRSGLRGAVKFAPILLLSLLLGACSAVPDWANPVSLWYDAFGEEDDKVADSSKSTAYRPYPKLSDTPQRPKSSSAQQQSQVTKGLLADREHAKYTDQQLRAGGTQSSVPPPVPVVVKPPSAESRPAAIVMEPPKPSAPLPTPQSASIDDGRPISVPAIVQRRARPQPTPSPIEEAAGKPITRLVQMPTSRAAAAPAQMPAQPVAVRTATPMVTRSPPMVQTNLPIGADQAALAQAFNASISQQISMMGPPGNERGFNASGVNPSQGGSTLFAAPGTQMGTLNGGPLIIHFGHSSTGLTTQAKNTIAKVARTLANSGGSVRVVGHASQRTRDMNYETHKRINFNISLDRAGAVAAALRRGGVAPQRIFVEARGSDQPVYHEFMPQGEAYNRRVEIYLQ